MNFEPTPIDSNNESDDEYDESTFFVACSNGNLKVVKAHLAQKGFNMNVCERHDGSNGFHYACRYGNLNVVQFLIQRGFDMNAGTNNGRTGFGCACEEGNLNVIEFLLEKGFDMNVGDNDGVTGFHLACHTGNLNVIEFLLEKGFNMNIGDTHGWTGFHCACCDKRLNVVQFYVQHGFEGINELNIDGKTGLTLMIERRNHYAADDERFMLCFLFLIEAGAELHEDDFSDELISAIKNRVIEITFMKEKFFLKWTGRIAQAISDFAIASFTNTALQNLCEYLD